VDGDATEIRAVRARSDAADPQLASALASLRIMDHLAASAPPIPRGSAIRVGDVHMAQGDLPAALENYLRSRTISERLRQTDQRKPDYLPRAVRFNRNTPRG
jgi:hypothetical protein